MGDGQPGAFGLCLQQTGRRQHAAGKDIALDEIGLRL
jgi:hypothetical protein